MFRKLDPEQIVATSSRLERRIRERFPGAGLFHVAAELTQVTREAQALSAWLAAPNRPLRTAVSLAIAVLLLVVLAAAATLRGETGPHNWADWVQSLEALINDVVFVGVAVYFLLGLEMRRKRLRALEALHVLRSLAHIVDMHQLTKDPDTTVAGGPSTPSSPARTMSAFELTRYLDYCTELLAIVSKVAALYVQELADPVTVSAANAVEELAVNLSRSIWQKIVILDRVAPSAACAANERPGGAVVVAGG
ncbi:MAG: hypothetical protein ABIQ16_26035 [Polyangiaceae bacterium]